MSVIKVENLTFSYPGSYDNIFENVSFQIDTDWKLGFVGRNGRGKTTFLNLLCGKLGQTGSIVASVQFDYFPYPVENKNRLTTEILEEICPNAEEWEIMRELSLLDVETDVLWREFSTLSNGEQTKALLAALFLNEGRFLLIDEPTNHLDTAARRAVAEYLKKKKGFILVSHDRNFLDSCVDHILSLNRSNIEVCQGDFSTWFENFERQQSFERSQNERLRKDITRLQQAARQASNWSDKVEASKNGASNSGSFVDKGYVGHKSAKMMQRAKNLENRRLQAVEEKSSLLKNAENTENLKIHPLIYRSDRLVELKDVAVCYDGKEICAPVRFDVKNGDRIVLDGKNGSGKSSLLKVIRGEKIETTGTVNIGSGLIVSYVPQDTSFLRGRLSDYAEEQSIDETLFKAILRKMDFERVQFEKDMADFSGGQKKKVLIAKSLCEKAHLYVWDEPLNFIDIYSRIQIENLICEFSPTMILVEHDAAFRGAVATETVEIRNVR